MPKIGFRVVEIRNIFIILHHSQSLYRRKFNPYSFDLYEFKRNYMGTLLQFKHFYLKAFEDCKPEIAVILLKAYSVFCLLLLFMAIYAFLFRMFTGFDFSRQPLYC